MTPISRRYTPARLIAMNFESAPRNGDPPSACPSAPPIVVEDGAFMSWWKPGWLERIKLLCGAPVRVKVNYSLYGPLHLDTESTWGAPSSTDW
jgi:hypothetical protein